RCFARAQRDPVAKAGKRPPRPQRRHVPPNGEGASGSVAFAGAAQCIGGSAAGRLAVGDDGRNRTLLSPFPARAGANQPSNSRFIFGPAVWLRSLIKPPPSYAVAYVDWSQQEFGIAAALSGDPAMQAAYNSGDPYLAFAKQVGAVPEDATKASHGPVRE